MKKKTKAPGLVVCQRKCGFCDHHKPHVKQWNCWEDIGRCSCLPVKSRVKKKKVTLGCPHCGNGPEECECWVITHKNGIKHHAEEQESCTICMKKK